MMYNKIVEDCFFNSNHVGLVQPDYPLSAHFKSHVPGQNNRLDLYLVCTKDKIIQRACFKAMGNPYMIAALEWICREIEGLELEQLPVINYPLLVETLAIPNTEYPVAIQVSQAYQEVVKLMRNTFEELKS
ncbi:MAG: hypothetical protein EPN84_05990 [Legionella sp.]|nr:MAG: hypothetical protein EPN84_05990 [Legionella sp.]